MMADYDFDWMIDCNIRTIGVDVVVVVVARLWRLGECKKCTLLWAIRQILSSSLNVN